MKAVILAGGMGTRLSEETSFKPKPMVEVGGRPVLWHIMKIYSAHGVNDFIVCCGYKGYVIKEYFANYFLHMSDVTFDMRSDKMEVHRSRTEPWRVTLLDTGEETATGGRLKRAASYLAQETEFCFTYGDGVGDINLTEAIAFHRQHGKLVTVTAVQPPGRYGSLGREGDRVVRFSEKPLGEGGLISGGFFILSPRVLDTIEGDETAWENAPIVGLVEAGEVMAFVHEGFWHPMDTLRDKNRLDQLWCAGKAPWKIW
ncbi:MAG: glucose-1-phosphate cytidylyltransferase [Holosporales bacterium]|jgi:glucose-1-phosphate cytidylyltransferase|nr:glucose-1-phosphate cytidylyltransferase [Holosporales bacterium]